LQDEFSEVCAQLFADLTEHLRAFAETTRQFADLRQKLAMLLSQALYSGEVAVRTPSDLSKIVDAYAKLTRLGAPAVFADDFQIAEGQTLSVQALLSALVCLPTARETLSSDPESIATGHLYLRHCPCPLRMPGAQAGCNVCSVIVASR
jgi:hypothetical protein